MRYVSPAKLRRLNALCRERHRRRLSRARARAAAIPRFAKRIKPAWYLRAPSTISVRLKEGADLCAFIQAIRHRVLRDGKKAFLDFSETNVILPDGALLLFAELDRTIALSHIVKPITVRYPRRKRVRQVLKQLGFANLCGDSVDIELDREDVIHWRCTKGSDQSGSLSGELLQRVTDKANEVVEQSLELEDVWRGVSEAIINTTDHAYSEDRTGVRPHPETRWWLLTCIKDHYFTAIVCDLGVGYSVTTPKTLPEMFIASVKHLLGGSNVDATAIQLAMKYGRSRTGQHERGKGSRDALSLLTNHGAGELAIMSNSGCVAYTFKDDDVVHRVESLPADIRATMVWWRLPLGEPSS